ncbi:hypothetical protein M8J77_010393 [Diaphorina citri]|nr:hypothetical protein M8J77_010393 [Diaphorina citri]
MTSGELRHHQMLLQNYFHDRLKDKVEEEEKTGGEEEEEEEEEKETGLALETMGPFCNEMKIFIDDIGNRLCEKTGDVKAKSFLYQRIGLAVQRGNGASVEGTFPAGDRFDEVFAL